MQIRTLTTLTWVRFVHKLYFHMPKIQYLRNTVNINFYEICKIFMNN